MHLFVAEGNVVTQQQATQRVQRIWDRQAELRRPQLAVADAGLELVHQDRHKAGIVDPIVARRAPSAGDTA